MGGNKQARQQIGRTRRDGVRRLPRLFFFWQFSPYKRAAGVDTSAYKPAHLQLCPIHPHKVKPNTEYLHLPSEDRTE